MTCLISGRSVHRFTLQNLYLLLQKKSFLWQKWKAMSSICSATYTNYTQAELELLSFCWRCFCENLFFISWASSLSASVCTNLSEPPELAWTLPFPCLGEVSGQVCGAPALVLPDCYPRTKTQVWWFPWVHQTGFAAELYSQMASFISQDTLLARIF